MLRAVWPDYAALRRYLVDAGLLARRRGSIGASAAGSTSSRVGIDQATGRARGGVPPFHVMRVIDAVVALRAAGLPSSTCRPASRRRRRPRRCSSRGTPRPAADKIGYTNALGIPPLRAAIAGHYRRTAGIDVEPSQRRGHHRLVRRLPATRSSPPSTPGDTVAMARPGYPAYRNMLAALGCRVLELPCGAPTRFQPTRRAARGAGRAAGRPRAGSPANPTGTMVAPDELAALAAWCDAHGTRLVSDEIYHGITYDEPAACAWQTSRRPIVVVVLEVLLDDGLADRLAARAGRAARCRSTGWPATSRSARRRCRSSPPVAAFDAYAELDANVARYSGNRDLLLRRLPEIGLDRLAPADGAFYIYADVSRWTDDSLGLGARLLDRGRRRGRARRRLRPGRRRPVHPDVLRRQHERDQPSRGCPRRVARSPVVTRRTRLSAAVRWRQPAQGSRPGRRVA